MAATDYLYINSADRVEATDTSTEFSVELDSPLENIECIEIKQLNIPNTLYTVKAGINDIITFTENATLKTTAALTPGYYSPANLGLLIAAAMTAASGGFNIFTVTYSTSTLKFTFSAGNNFQLHGAATYFPYRELGLLKANSSTSTSIVSTNVSNLSLPETIWLSISQFDLKIQTSSNTNKKYVTALYPIPVDVNFGGIIQLNPEVPYRVRVPIRSANKLKVSLIDVNGTPLNLNGADWSCYLKFISSIQSQLMQIKRKRPEEILYDF